MGSGASMASKENYDIIQATAIEDLQKHLQTWHPEHCKKLMQALTNTELAAPPGMCPEDAVSEAMKARQRRNPVQWTMSAQEWWSVFDHIFDQPKHKLNTKATGRVTMYIINENFIKPWTRSTGCSLAVLMSKDRSEPAKMMLSHAWGEDVEELVEVVQSFSKRTEMKMTDPIWFCVFSNYQPEDRCGPTIAEQIDMDPFGSVVNSPGIRKAEGGFGMLAVHTTTVDLYTRLWCVYELSEAMLKADVEVVGGLSEAYVEDVSGRIQGLLDGGASMKAALVASGLEIMSSTAECSNHRDKDMIHGHVHQLEGGFQKLDNTIKLFRLASLPDVLFGLTRYAFHVRRQLQGKTINVWRIGPGCFPYHDALVARMQQLGVDWKETHIIPGDVENPFVGSPAISAAWSAVVAFGTLPDLVWEEGGRLTQNERNRMSSTEILTRNSGILYYMNSVTMYAPKSAPGHKDACKLMQVFDDFDADAEAWQLKFPRASITNEHDRACLKARFTAVVVAAITQDIESLAPLCHSQSDFLLPVHQKQLKSVEGALVVRAHPVCIWGNQTVAVVYGLVSFDASESAGCRDYVSFWMREGVEWRLLTITDDPVNTDEEALTCLGDWCAQHLMASSLARTVVDNSSSVSIPRFQPPDPTERFGEWSWTPAGIAEPFVQIVDFHYGAATRLFFLDASTCSVSDGELWTTGDTWTVRVWTLSSGSLTIGERTEFQH